MRKKLLFLLFIVLTTSCGTTKTIDTQHIELSFLDDFIIAENLEVDGTKVGGLSGIDYHNGTYFLVCDHPGNPRFYKASIEINQGKIDTVLISGMTELDQTSEFLKNHTLDLEAIRYDASKNEFVLSSEGSIHKGKNPAIFNVTPNGAYRSQYSLPEYFLASGEQKPRNNGVFEGLAESFTKSGFWVAMELPLEKDGSKPKVFPTKSPIRITHFNKENGTPTRQFVMQLEHITKIPWMYFAVNGLTEILEYAPERFIVLERAFSAGHGTQGNTVRIFDLDARKASNTLNIEVLKKKEYTAATKKLVFDFKSVRGQLKENTIDNLEGMTFGPDLPNGNKTLLLVSDNNFNSLGKQISQVILMEIAIKL